MDKPTLFDIHQGGQGESAQTQLAQQYQQGGVTLDDLPYTDAFEALHALITGPQGPGGAYARMSRSELFHKLHNMRKAKQLPRLGPSKLQRPRLDPQHEKILASLVQQHIGKLSLRDRLPYTDDMDRIVEQFAAATGLNMAHHAVWRVIAKLAK